MNRREIYLAGGCFWGLELLMSKMSGVTETCVGYANGTNKEDANYRKVCYGNTGFRECVRVGYNPDDTTLDRLLFAFYHVIDPTITDRQGADFGPQYQTGIYWTDEETAAAVMRLSDTIKPRHKHFAVELIPLKNFFEAEEEHQMYLEKRGGGYCHISKKEIDELTSSLIDPGHYKMPSKEQIDALDHHTHRVIIGGGTEAAFIGKYDKHFERGLYVDVITGEPLFSSKDKFECGCGWPAFTQPIDPLVVTEKEDYSFGMYRSEVRSRISDGHLGHVFEESWVKPTGRRYCINSVCLRFVPYDKMDADGYGYLKGLV